MDIFMSSMRAILFTCNLSSDFTIIIWLFGSNSILTDIVTCQTCRSTKEYGTVTTDTDTHKGKITRVVT
jgi:hypothetical protein